MGLSDLPIGMIPLHRSNDESVPLSRLFKPGRSQAVDILDFDEYATWQSLPERASELSKIIRSQVLPIDFPTLNNTLYKRSLPRPSKEMHRVMHNLDIDCDRFNRALGDVGVALSQGFYDGVQKTIQKMKGKETMNTKETLTQKLAEAYKIQKILAETMTDIAKLNEFNETECTVTMRPVCDCGHVFDNLSIQPDLMSRKDDCIPDVTIPRFDPTFCPKCHKRIMAISNPARKTSNGFNLDCIEFAKVEK